MYTTYREYTPYWLFLDASVAVVQINYVYIFFDELTATYISLLFMNYFHRFSVILSTIPCQSESVVRTVKWSNIILVYMITNNEFMHRSLDESCIELPRMTSYITCTDISHGTLLLSKTVHWTYSTYRLLFYHNHGHNIKTYVIFAAVDSILT